MRETFILLSPQVKDPETIVRAVETMDGRVLLSFPPCAVVALLPPERLDDLRTNPAVGLVTTDEIAAESISGVPDATRTAVAAWNEHLARGHRRRASSSEGLSWDAPHHLAPDPPRHIQEMLRRREQELKRDDG
jgi:hypothetical protein